jgi:DNA-directed RNA polymerase subunit omega
MARITVEDCLEKIDSQYDLVLLAKERTTQLNSGEKPAVSEDNDKNTVISLREIGEGKISIKAIEESAINKLRKVQHETKAMDDLEVEEEDDFDKIYKGESSKSGAAILPSKRVRKIPLKFNTVEKKEDKSIEESEQDTEVQPESDEKTPENKTE